MLDFEELKQLCKPILEEKPFYRPLLSQNKSAQIPIFIVGINPATPIYPNEMDLEAYTNLIINYEEFIAYYKDLRKQRKKKMLSQTRIGINGLGNWLRNRYGVEIAETNVISYPSQKPKELRSEPKEVIERGKDVFVRVLLAYQPKILIAHGQETFQALNQMVHNRPEFKWLQIETGNSFNEIGFTYEDGQSCKILPCSHLRYHGHNGGKRFSELYSHLPSVLDKAGFVRE